MTSLTELLKPIANWFSSLGVPEPIIHWGHPAMMAVVIFVMGTFVGVTGWRCSSREPPSANANHRRQRSCGSKSQWSS